MHEFELWLIKDLELSISSAYKYSKAISTLSDEFLNGKTLYSITEFAQAQEMTDNIVSHPLFDAKNKKGHHMYSCALNHYLEYLK